MSDEQNIGIRKGTERGLLWGLGEIEWDNRGLDETWIHLYNEDNSDYRTIVIGIEDAVDVVENAFENSLEEDSEDMRRVTALCDELRALLQKHMST